ncbi:carbohydrate ABC transporter permease [Vallitalea pronyensis]|uniref:Carbohydrate ABC transporter permease n=2 Tax=Vallitalea pronyensis TaxID=1348613 RepID=A0A8J8MQA2_9FIRM|nr:carbohydrate ABC transporter permease [Vallitalea pronyensis]
MKKNVVNSVQVFMLLIMSVFFLFPIYIAVINAFKTDGEMARSILSLPQVLSFHNFITAFRKLDFLRTTFNTFIIASLSVIGIVITSSMAAYKITTSKLPAARFFYLLFVASMLIPFHSIMISLTRTAINLGVKGSLLGTVTIYIGLGVNMAIFLYSGFVKTIPMELEEAAVIDGCGPFRVYWHIIFPLLKPITATIAILDVLWIWNDFLLPLLMITNSKNYTLILSANKFFGKYEADWTSVLAGLLMTSLPLVIFYLIFQKHIVKGITAGSVKG